MVLSLIVGRPPSRDTSKLLLRPVVPWFIVGFLLLAAHRSWGVIRDVFLTFILPTASLLAIISMAALGLGVELRVLGRVGGRVTLAVTLSLIVLIGISLGLNPSAWCPKPSPTITRSIPQQRAKSPPFVIQNLDKAYKKRAVFL